MSELNVHIPDFSPLGLTLRRFIAAIDGIKPEQVTSEYILSRLDRLD